MELLLDEFNRGSHIQTFVHAGFWRRFGALILDFIIILPIRNGILFISFFHQ